MHLNEQRTTTGDVVRHRNEETVVDLVVNLGLAVLAGAVVTMAAYAVGVLLNRTRCGVIAALWPDDITLEYRCQRYVGHSQPHREGSICWTDDGEVMVDV